MVSAAFLLQKWPKRHEYLIEECVAARRVLHVGDVLPDLMHWSKALISRWNPPTHPHLTLVPRMGGPFRRWWFLCPRCRRRCEALYVLPGAGREDWRCRVCHGLIYASQRYGFRHPLRRVLTHRKRTTRRKDVLRFARRIMRRQVRVPVAAGPQAEAEWWATAEGAKRLEDYFAGRQPGKAGVVTMPTNPRSSEATREAEALIAAEAERSLATLRDLAARADSKRVREQARRDLHRYGGRLDDGSRGRDWGR